LRFLPRVQLFVLFPCFLSEGLRATCSRTIDRQRRCSHRALRYIASKQEPRLRRTPNGSQM